MMTRTTGMMETDKANGTAIVILNWNGKRFLEKFLPSLLHSAEVFNSTLTGRSGADDGQKVISDGLNGKTDATEIAPRHPLWAEVIVADNASTDGSMEMMAEKFPSVRTVVFDRNYGFTGGYNRAFRSIRSRYFLLINSDIETPEDWLSPLVGWMESHPECGICAPKLHSWQNREMFEYAGAAGGYIDRFGYPFCRGRVMSRVEKDEGQYDSPADVFWATGACLLIRSSLYDALGGLDERFFAHMEEIDLCWRAQLAGHRVTVVPQSTVYHIGGGTLPQNSPWKLQLNFRNNLLMLDNSLAKTIALKSMVCDTDDTRPASRNAAGEAAGKAARALRRAAATGVRKARARIFMRMVLDGCSAAVYLVTLRLSYFSAVVKAHSEYRRLRRGTDVDAVLEYLKSTRGKRPEIKGMSKGWMIPRALLGLRIRM